MPQIHDDWSNGFIDRRESTGLHDRTAPSQVFVPRTRGALVRRERLLDSLEEAARRPLTVVSAPAGFGKTTLLADWIRQTRRAVAWLSIDEQGADLRQFIAGIGAALRNSQAASELSAAGGFVDRGSNDQLWTSTSILDALIQDLSGISKPLTVVVDDYHFISDEQIHGALVKLVDAVPDTVNFTICARRPPALPLTRMRILGRVTVFTGDQLRFTLDEAREFLRSVMRLDLTGEEVDGLHESMEGWITGLQLAAISLQDGAHVADLLGGATSSNKYALDYLFEEILQRQPSDVQIFLRETAILDQLTVEMCEFVTGIPESRQLLDRIVAEILFVVAIDDQDRVFRYHHLFKSLLIRELERRDPNRARALRSRASSWHENVQQYRQAVAFAIAAEEWDQVARLLDKTGSLLLLPARRFRDWLQALPRTTIASNPTLALWQAYAQVVAGNVKHSRQTEARLRSILPPTSPLYPALMTLGPLIDWLSGKGESAIERAAAVIETCRDNPYALCTALGRLGLVNLSAGKPADAERSLAQAVSVANTFETNMCDISLRYQASAAHAQLAQGRLTEAAETNDAVARRASTFYLEPPTKYYYVSGEIALMRNDLQQARSYFRETVEACTRADDAFVRSDTWLSTIALKCHLNDFAGAILSADEMISWCNRNGNTGMKRMGEIARMRVRLQMGEVADVAAWLRSRIEPAPRRIAYLDEELYYLYIDYAIHRHGHRNDRPMLEGCAAILNCLTEQAVSAERGLHVARAHLAHAETLSLLGRGRDALTLLDMAAERLLPEGAIRPLIDRRDSILGILRDEGIPAEEYRHLTAAREILEDRSTAIEGGPASRPISPITAREREILNLIALGLTNDEIANSLVVSQNTVKTHIKSIFGKLEAHSRTQAITIARSGGLI
jgi:LuxR family maltose regulon positive regulatory protein